MCLNRKLEVTGICMLIVQYRNLVLMGNISDFIQIHVGSGLLTVNEYEGEKYPLRVSNPKLKRS
jgi:hypothetical protein